MPKSELSKYITKRTPVSKLLLCAAPLLLAGCTSSNIYGVAIPTGYTHTTKGTLVHGDTGYEPIAKASYEDMVTYEDPDEPLVTPVDPNPPVEEKVMVPATNLKVESVQQEEMYKQPPMQSHSAYQGTHQDAPIALTKKPAHTPPPIMNAPKPSAMNDAAMDDSAMTPAYSNVPEKRMAYAPTPSVWNDVSETLVALLFKKAGVPLKPVYVTTVAGTSQPKPELENSIRRSLENRGVSVAAEPSARPVVLEYDVVRLGGGESDQALVTFVLYQDDGRAMEVNRMFTVR